jgi:hypothetical protein
MQERWERWLTRAEAETTAIRSQAAAYDRGRRDALTGAEAPTAPTTSTPPATTPSGATPSGATRPMGPGPTPAPPGDRPRPGEAPPLR